MTKFQRYNSRIPNLRHRIQFLSNVKHGALDADNWQERLVTFASISHISEMQFNAIESFNFGHVMTESLVVFTIRFIDLVNNKMRIVFRDKTFEIKRIINPGEMCKFLNIIALEI